MTYYTKDEVERLNAEYARVAKVWKSNERAGHKARKEENERQRLLAEHRAAQRRKTVAIESAWLAESMRYEAQREAAEATRKAKLAARTEQSIARERRSRIDWLEVTGDGTVASRQVNWERRASALAMRKAGLKFSEVARRMDVCTARARQMVEQAEREAGKRSPAEVWMGKMKINPDMRGWQVKVAVNTLLVMPKHDPEADWIWAGLAA